MAVNDKLKEISAMLESGVKEVFESGKYEDYLKTMSRFHNYSTRNSLLIHLQNPAATRVAGYNAWKNNFNRQVKKGEKAIRIYAPASSKESSKEKSIEVPKLDKETGLPVLGEDGQPVMETLLSLSALEMRFRAVPVFDISQTEGDPLPELAETLTGDVERYDAFMDALKAVSPLPIEFAPLNADMDGRCILGEKIEIREGMSEAQTISATVHEIAHSVMHDRTKELDGTGEPKSRRVIETEAESVSYVVSQYFGIETGANSFGYIAEYAKNRELKELNASLDTIRKASAALIDAIGEKYRELAKDKERGIDPVAAPETPEKTGEAVETPAAVEETESPRTTARYSEFQKQGFEVAESLKDLPLRDRLGIIAETFGCKTGRIETHPCTGKWRGTSDIFIVFDNDVSLFIGNNRTPNVKKAAVINECVNAALAKYNPKTVAEAKRRGVIALLEQERRDNAVAAERGLKPYKVLNVELNDGSNPQSGAHLGWYYVTLAVDGKVFGFLETGLKHDIERAEPGYFEKHDRDYFVAGGLEDAEVDFVFNNVGHSSLNDRLYRTAIGADVIKRAHETLERREQFAVLKQTEQTERTERVPPPPPTPAPKRSVPKDLCEKMWEQFPRFMSKECSYLRLESSGFEPLSLEWIGKDRFSMMHTYTLNGDLCYDPDIVFEVNRDAHTVSAVQFQQSIPPLYQERQDTGEWLSVDGNGNQTTVNGLEKSVNDFAKQWLANIGEQGYMPVRANLEIDGEETQITFTKDGDPILPDDGEPPEAQYELGYGFLGNGITVWNKAEMNAENDYRTVAHINTDRTVDFYDKDMPDDVKAKIIKTAESPDTWAFGFDSAPGRETVQRKETTLDLSLPDPNWTVAEMFEYGYKREDMFPLSVGRAVELFDAGHTIYLLYDDNTEAVAFDRDEIITFSSDGFCGITKTDWEMSPVRDAQNKVYENVIPNREQIENSRESESKSVSISDLSKKPGIVEKLNAINNALKKSPDAPERVPVNDRGESR